MAILQINNNLARKMKKRGFFGDYILAKRLQPNNGIYRGELRNFICCSLIWEYTPQGYKFWETILL